jgi:hypothetical protein
MKPTFQDTDLSSDDNLLTSGEPTSEELGREFTRPGDSWMGQPLRPCTAGTDLLFTQVLDRNDATRTAVVSFIFVHLAEHEREKLLELCWDKTKFRIALLEWIEKLAPTPEDYIAADNLFVEMREGARKTSIAFIPEGTEKKTKASRRRISLS